MRHVICCIVHLLISSPYCLFPSLTRIYSRIKCSRYVTGNFVSKCRQFCDVCLVIVSHDVKREERRCLRNVKYSGTSFLRSHCVQRFCCHKACSHIPIRHRNSPEIIFLGCTTMKAGGYTRPISVGLSS